MIVSTPLTVSVWTSKTWGRSTGSLVTAATKDASMEAMTESMEEMTESGTPRSLTGGGM
jgi:hypothetical protein